MCIQVLVDAAATYKLYIRQVFGGLSVKLIDGFELSVSGFDRIVPFDAIFPVIKWLFRSVCAFLSMSSYVVTSLYSMCPGSNAGVLSARRECQSIDCCKASSRESIGKGVPLAPIEVCMPNSNGFSLCCWANMGFMAAPLLSFLDT